MYIGSLRRSVKEKVDKCKLGSPDVLQLIIILINEQRICYLSHKVENTHPHSQTKLHVLGKHLCNFVIHYYPGVKK